MLLIVTTLLARLLFAASLGLGVDESYMVAASRSFHLGYFDHPPVAWWLTWATLHVAGSDTETVVRLPFVLLFALSTWLMFRLTAELFDECAGLWAAVVFNAVPVLGVTAGSWVLPDGPLIAALLGSTLCLVRAMPATGRAAWLWWLGAGTCFGLALCSKYTAVLVGAGAMLFLVSTKRGTYWLSRPHPYAAALVVMLLFSPVIGWNAENGWVSVLFQAGRADTGRWHLTGPFLTIAGEALFFLPWIWAAVACCLWQAARIGRADHQQWLLLCLSLPTLLVFEVISLRSHVLFHWAAPGTMMALPLVGAFVARHRRYSRFLRLTLTGTAILLPLGAVLVGSEVRFNWMPEVGEAFALGTDPDLDAVDWTSLRKALLARGELQEGLLVGAIRWHDAGKVDYALKGMVPVICLGDDPREYGLSTPALTYAGADVLIVAPREDLTSMSTKFAASFDRIEALQPVMLLHAGRPAMLLPLFRGYGLHPKDGSSGSPLEAVEPNAPGVLQERVRRAPIMRLPK